MAGLSTPVRAGAAAFASPRDTTPTPSRARHVKAVLLAMGQERRLLASYVHWDREEPMSYRDKLQGILNSSVWKRVLADRKSTSYELRVGASTVFCLEIDEDWRVFVVVSTTGYPSRHVFSGTSDSNFRAHVLEHFALPSLSSEENGLQGSLAPFLRRLCAKYDDLDALSGDGRAASPSHTPTTRRESDALALPSPMSEGTRLLYALVLFGALAIAGIVVVVLNYAAFHWWGVTD